MSNVELDKRKAASYRHACVRECMHARVCECVCVCSVHAAVLWDTRREALPHAGQGQRAVREGQEGQKHKALRGTAPPAESRPFRMYLTLRVLSSLDQESVEGKEGRDEEEVTSALLPIWKGKKKHTRENTNKQNPYHLPWLQPIFPSKRILKSYSLCEISADISVTGGLTATLADDRCPEMFNPLEKCLP